MKEIKSDTLYKVYVTRGAEWDFQLDYMRAIIARIRTIRRAAAELFEFVCFHTEAFGIKKHMNVKYLKDEDRIVVTVGFMCEDGQYVIILKLEEKR